MIISRVPALRATSAGLEPPQMPSGSGGVQGFSRQQRIHGAGAKAFQVERHELEAQSLLKMTVNSAAISGVRARGQFLARDFDANNFAVMAHAELAETESAQRRPRPAPPLAGLRGLRAPVLDARRKAGRRGLVPDSQSSMRARDPGCPALVSPASQQRRSHVVLAAPPAGRGGSHPGRPVHAVSDGVKTVVGAELLPSP